MPSFCSNCGKSLEPESLRCPACGVYILPKIKQIDTPYIDNYHEPMEYRKPHIIIKLVYLSFYVILIISGFFPYLHYHFRTSRTSPDGHESVSYVYYEMFGFGIIFFWGAVILFLISVILLFTHRRVLGSMITGFIGDFFMLQVVLFINLFRSNEYIGESWLGIGYYIGMLASAGLGCICLILIGYLGQVKD